MGVPIVLLPLLSSSPTQSTHNTDGAQEAQKPCCSSSAPGRTNASAAGWGPPSLTRRTPHTTPARPSFPFPPRPPSYSGPASKSGSTSAQTSPSSVTQPMRTNVQSPNKASSPPSSPTSPYPSSYSNRPSTTSPSVSYPYSSFHQRTQAQPQSRSSWTQPSSLSHLKPASPIKPREKPKFEFITLLESGRTNPCSGPSPSDGPNGVEARPEAPPLDSISKFPSGLTEIESKDHDQEHDLEDHDQDHDLISVTSSSSCPSLCTSSCPSCSASEVETDQEHDIETNGRSHFLRGFSPRSSLSSSFSSPPFDLNVGLPLAEEVERHMTKKKPEPKKKKERKFILVNDMEIELDDSGDEDEDEETTPLSGSIVSTTTSTTRDVTTTTTTKTISTVTTITTTTSTQSPSSPQSIIAPVPVKSTLLGPQPPSPSLSASLITPPITPPSEQIPRSGSRSKSLHSSPSSPSTASRGRMKKVVVGHAVGSSTSRERSGSTGSDTSGKTSPTSPTRNVMTGMCLPVKFKKQDGGRSSSGSPSVRV